VSVRVSPHVLSIPQAYSALRDPLSGGVVLFVGRVRPDAFGNGRVGSLLYEAHVSLAERALTEIEREARRRFRARRVVLWHRTGVLRIGTPSVLVGVATPHRADAFRAASWLIAELKRKAPIWKTERVRPGRRPR
jgi:molybdopterin synthase catalytic subunit